MGTISYISEVFRGIFFASAVFFVLYGVYLAREAEQGIKSDHAQVHSALLAAKPKVGQAYNQLFNPDTGVPANADKLVRAVRSTVDTFHQMAVTERVTYYEPQLKLANDTAQRFNDMLATAQDMMKKLNAAGPSLYAQIMQTTNDMHLTFTASARALNALADDLSDPSIKQSLDNVAGLTAALRDAAQHGDKVAIDVEKIADHYEIKIDSPLTKGQKFVVGAKVASVIIGNLFKGVL